MSAGTNGYRTVAYFVNWYDTILHFKVRSRKPKH